YVVDPKGAIRLVRTPPLSAAENHIEQTTEMWIGADGSSRCERVSVSRGSAAMAQRDTFLEVPGGERRRQVTTELQDAHSRARLVHLHVNEDELPIREVEIDFHLCLNKGTIEPADFDAYRKFHEEVSGTHRAWLTLKPAQESTDAPLLEAYL